MSEYDIRKTVCRLLVVTGLGLILFFAGCSREEDTAALSQEQINAALNQKQMPPKQPAAYFTTRPVNPRAVPEVVRISVPEELGGKAIWGSTGRDSRGHIWFGLCMAGTLGASARLLEYDPDTGEIHARGDVLSALKETGHYRDGDSQSKIHSQIIQAEDGYLYFASMDESGADYKQGTEPPTWGGHLWRLHLPDNKWEHLLSAPEGLIAVSGDSGKVYALGFFGHKLYQYDCKAGVVRSVEVGSVGGHISRNFITDYRNHAYVPRLRRNADTDKIRTTLVEFDADLKEIHETPLAYYCGDNARISHGITALQPMADHSIIFSTALGYLYRVTPPQHGYAAVREIGWLHPDKQRYVASLFTYTGKGYVMGLATDNKDTHPGKRYEWVVYHTDVPHIEAIGGTALDFTIKGENAPPDIFNCLLYGSTTRDNAGNFYVVGTWHSKGKPLILKVLCPK